MITAFAADTLGYVIATLSNNCGIGVTDSIAVDPGPFDLLVGYITDPLFTQPHCGDTVILQLHQGFMPSGYELTSNQGLHYNWNLPSAYTLISNPDSSAIAFIVNDAPNDVSVTVSTNCGSELVNGSVYVYPHYGVGLVASNPSTCFQGAQMNEPGQLATVNVDSWGLDELQDADSIVWQVPAGYSIQSGQGTPMLTYAAGSTNGTIVLTQYFGCNQSAISTLDAIVGDEPCTITNAQVFGPTVGDEFHYRFERREIDGYWGLDQVIETRYIISNTIAVQDQGAQWAVTSANTNFILNNGVWEFQMFDTTLAYYATTGLVSDTLIDYQCYCPSFSNIGCGVDTLVEFGDHYVEVDWEGEQAFEYEDLITVARNIGVAARSHKELIYYAGQKTETKLVHWQLAGSSACGPIGIPDSLLAGETSPLIIPFIIFPNPNNGIFQVSNVAAHKNFDFEVFNSSGQLLVKRAFKNGRVDLSELSNGIYMLRIFNQEEVFHRKIIIQ